MRYFFTVSFHTNLRSHFEVSRIHLRLMPVTVENMAVGIRGWWVKSHGTPWNPTGTWMFSTSKNVPLAQTAITCHNIIQAQNQNLDKLNHQTEKLGHLIVVNLDDQWCSKSYPRSWFILSKIDICFMLLMLPFWGQQVLIIIPYSLPIAHVFSHSFFHFPESLIWQPGSIPINTIFSGMNIHLPAILMFTMFTRDMAMACSHGYGTWDIPWDPLRSWHQLPTLVAGTPRSHRTC